MISWEEVLRSGVFLGHNDHQLLERAQQNLAVILDNAADAKNLATMLLKIADNCTSNLTVQQYVFTRVEEILGLGMDWSDADVDVYGAKHAHLFTADGKRTIDAPFLRALNSPDIYLQKSASLGLACLYTKCEGNIQSLVQWINSKLSSPAAGKSINQSINRCPTLIIQCPTQIIYHQLHHSLHTMDSFQSMSTNQL